MVLVWWFVACAPSLTVEAPTCDVDFLDWAGGLTFDVLQGNGRGSFDYRPTTSDIVESRSGSYDLSSGEFAWTVSYGTGAFRVAERADGIGTLWPDGDLDLGYTLQVELLDRSETVEVRDLRLGCEVARRVEDGEGRVDVYEGEIQPTLIDYTHQFTDGDRLFEATGQRTDDGTWTERLDFEDETLAYAFTETGNLRDWSWEREISYVTPGIEIEGSYRRRVNGRLNVTYQATIDGSVPETWDYRLDGEGSGNGTLQLGNDAVPCTLTFTDGSCVVSDCVASGPCVPPLATDEVLLRL
ncbi:MAG: hypothetical protein AAF211_22185 [Myxococcota bacterium]